MDTLDLWKVMQVEELAEKLDGLFQVADFSVEGMLEKLLAGDLYGVYRDLCACCKSMLFIDWQGLRRIFLCILLLGLASAVFVQFAEIMPKYKVAELCFTLIYLLQAAILTKCFISLMEIARTAVDNILLFVKLMLPFFLLSVSMATGTLTAGAGGQLFLLLAYAVENVLSGGFLTAITVFFLFSVLEGMEGTGRWENLLELIKKALEGGVKAMLAGIAALGMLQTILMPALDSLKGSALERIVSSLPGLGNGVESVFKLAAGSALVIKNSIGVLLLLLLILLCTMPLLRILSLAVTLKILGALLGLVCNKRLTKALDRAGETGILLFRVTGCAMILFWLAIAMTTVSLRHY